MGDLSQYSQNAACFTMKGSAQVGSYRSEDPFFVQHEFDASTSRLYLRGSVSTGTFFEITVNRPR